MEHIDQAIALIEVKWREPEEGGRASGPPAGPVYRANCAFVLGGDEELEHGWPFESERYMSIILERARSRRKDGGDEYMADFVARDLAFTFLRRNAELLIMEGPKIVGSARVCEVLKGAEFVHEHPHPGED